MIDALNFGGSVAKMYPLPGSPLAGISVVPSLPNVNLAQAARRVRNIATQPFLGKDSCPQ
jgi:hypothetical protein